jgi:hypothetical protein
MDIKQALAILNQSTLFGLSDGRFIAMFGGLLFIDKQFSEAERFLKVNRERDHRTPQDLL